MSIVPLPQFEADVAEFERERLIETLRCRGHDPGQLASLETGELETLAKKKRKTSLVIRYGATKMIGEFPYSGDITPGCGSRLVVRTHRGVEMGELLTSTCPNSGCGSSVSRKEMLEYIENSGGRQYPFSTDGRVLRVATGEDMDEQARLDQSRHGLKMEARAVVESMRLGMTIVEAEPILGGDRLTFYYTSEDRVDFRELVRELSGVFRTRIDMRQVGARDEARLTADYEKCGQYCCCKNFLKVLRPVSMKSAKVQKATLDPVKISGRCGRLMCCLRYEDESYESLAKNLPRRRARVGTPDGDGVVVSTQILTQLVLVRLDDDGEAQAYPVEEIGAPGERPVSSGPARERARREPERGRSKRKPAPGSARTRTPVSPPAEPPADAPAAPTDTDDSGTKKKRRRRRRRKRTGDEADGGDQAVQASGESPAAGEGGAESPGEGTGPAEPASDAPVGEDTGPPGPKKKRRRRRRRRPRSTENGGGDGGGETGGDGSGEG